MKVVVFYGSVRSQRQGIKACRFIVRCLQDRGHDVFFADPLNLRLPLIDRMYKEYDKGYAPESLELLARRIKEADGFVVVSGEYNHSIQPGLSNILDHFLEEFYFRPSAIVCYSAYPFGGVRAAMQLRAMLAELGMPPIPSIFPIPKVGDFSDDGTPPDERFERNVVRFLDEFEWYMRAFAAERKNGVPY